MNKIIKHSVFYVFFIFTSFLCSNEEKELSDLKNTYLYNTQDINGDVNISFLKFSFIANIPVFGHSADQINKIIEKELKTIGTVNKKEVFVSTENKKGVDLTGFAVEAMLIYEIKDLKAIDGSDLGIIRASLNLSANIELRNCSQRAYIWSSNCFVKGSTKKDLEKNVAETLDFLIKQFNANYLKFNKTKPVINLIIS